MKKTLLFVVALTVSLSLMVAFSLGGCKPAVSVEEVPEVVEEEFVMPGAGEVEDFEFAPWIVEKVENNRLEDLKIVNVYFDTSIPFFTLLKAGVDQAAVDLGIDAEITGPSPQDVREQVAIIENLITMKVDGIVSDNINPEAMNAIHKAATEAGIPLVTFNSDAEGSTRMGFYGQDLIQSGRTQAEILIEYMGEKGKIFIISGDIAATWSQDRVAGNEETFAKYPDIEIVESINAGKGKWDASEIYSDIETALYANQDITGMVTMDVFTTPAAGRLIIRENLIGKIFHVGHDLPPETLENIATGATNASLSQNPFAQGYESVKALYEFIVNGTAPTGKDTGILRVDETDVQEYIDKLEAGEPVG